MAEQSSQPATRLIIATQFRSIPRNGVIRLKHRKQEMPCSLWTLAALSRLAVAVVDPFFSLPLGTNYLILACRSKASNGGPFRRLRWSSVPVTVLILVTKSILSRRTPPSLLSESGVRMQAFVKVK